MVLELEHVHLVHRHGERTPLLYGPHDKTNWNLCHRASKISHTIPSNAPTLMDKARSLINYLKTGQAEPMHFNVVVSSGREFNCAPGQLTDAGRANLFNLGTWFREKYLEKSGLISPAFKKEEFFLRSTNFQRTLESLQSLMQGMYRTYSGSLDVEVRDLTADTLGCNRHCPKLKTMKAASHKNVNQAFSSKAKEIKEYFSRAYNSHLSSLSPYAIYELVASSRAHGFSRFKHVPSTVMKDLEEYSINLWFKHLNDPSALSLETGCLLKEISDQMVEKATNANPRKVSIYSAHDVTIYPLLMAMGSHTKKWPKFGANLIFEMHKNQQTGERYVQMRYNGERVPIPKCASLHQEEKGLCPLEDFVRICNDTYMSNFSEACLEE
ncbi:lysophosphatidic acid phosphatase type 6 [Nematocida displodere]|uniref:Lysophosphatidic acid phosphatase type 6 n=1 Tax=Nematocida displodere TaxID=1805483 RepID=A0A177EJH4_9MICR|nr:lysophosphatidic acid phosphatase type 6 [Nematocida displodere]